MSIPVEVGTPSPQGFMMASATIKAHLGRTVDLQDGRRFVYCRNGSTTVNAGRVVQTSGNWGHTSLAITPVEIGSDVVTIPNIGGSALSANVYADGYLIVNAGDGMYGTYRIKSHPSVSANASLKVTLQTPLLSALTASSRVTLVVHNCGWVEETTAVPLAVIGVSPIRVLPYQYFWAQQRGIASVLANAAVAAGQDVVPTSGGSVKGKTAMTEASIGVALVATASGEARPVLLKIA